MANVPTTNVNAYYSNTSPGNTILSSVIDAAIQDIVQTINDNWAIYEAFVTNVTLPIPDQSIVERHIRNLAITNPKLAPLAVTNDKIADGTITAAKLADLLITTAKLADLSVTNGKLVALAVTGDKIANSTITTDKLQDLLITTGKIADQSVTEPKLGTGSVSSRALAPQSVTASKLEPSLVAPISDAGIQYQFGLVNERLSETPKKYYNAVEAQSSGKTISQMITECKASGSFFYVPNGQTLVINEILDLTWINVKVDGTIQSNVHGISVIIGASSTSPMTSTVDIFAVTHVNYQVGDISVQIQGVMNGDISIKYAQKVKLWADGNIPSIASISYSKFSFGTIYRLEISSNLTASVIGWITECIFTGGRYLEISIDGNFDHEELIFIKPCLENGTLTMNRGVNCKFIQMRNEDTATNFRITLGPKTHGNVIELGTVESGWSTIYFTDFLKGNGQIIDNGRENFITNQISANYKESVVFDLIANVTVKSNWSAYRFPTFAAGNIAIAGDGTYFTLTNFTSVFKKTFPVGNIRRFKIGFEGINDYGDGVARGYNVSILCYDANKNLITNTQSVSSLNIQYFTANGAHTFAGPQGNDKHFLITNNNVSFIRISIFANGDLNPSKIKRLAFSLYTNPTNEYYANLIKEDVLRRDYKLGMISQSTATDVTSLKNDLNNLITKLTQAGVIGGIQDATDINNTGYTALETLYGLPIT